MADFLTGAVGYATPAAPINQTPLPTGSVLVNAAGTFLPHQLVILPAQQSAHKTPFTGAQ